jgi:hypothetical protein
MNTPESAEQAFLDHAGDLTVHDLWHHDHPDDCLTSLGYKIVWSRSASQSKNMTDYLLRDSDDNWYAIRLGDFGADGVLHDWDEKPYRLLLLFHALCKPFAGPCPTPGEMAQQLAADEHATFDAGQGDLWASPLLLSAALALLDSDDLAAHETLIAFKHPTVLPSLSRLRNWSANTDDQQARARAHNTLNRAAARLWPTLMTGVDLPLEHTLPSRLLEFPVPEWDHAAEAVLEEDAFAGRESLIFDFLAVEWAAGPREVYQFTEDILRSLTTPAGVSPRHPATT